MSAVSRDFCLAVAPTGRAAGGRVSAAAAARSAARRAPLDYLASALVGPAYPDHNGCSRRGYAPAAAAGRRRGVALSGQARRCTLWRPLARPGGGARWVPGLWELVANWQRLLPLRLQACSINPEDCAGSCRPCCASDASALPTPPTPPRLAAVPAGAVRDGAAARGAAVLPRLCLLPRGRPAGPW